MATTTGTMTSKVSSTVASPTVHYSAAYTATRSSDSSKTLSVKLDFAGWLSSSASKLGTGIKLTIYARINSGTWQSAVLKSTSATWSGTTKHTASLTLSASTTTSTAKIEWYVSRTGSTYSGTAGTLGSAGSPKSYTITVPAYSAGTTQPTEPDNPDPPVDSAKYVHVTDNGIPYEGMPYVTVSEIPRDGIETYVCVDGTYISN